MSNLLNETIFRIKPIDFSLMERAAKRQATLTKPLGSLGQLEDLSIRICGIKGQPNPKLSNKVIITMAADHGIATESVSLYPQEVTRQMVMNFLRGGAAINVMASACEARVVVVDMGVKGGFAPLPGLQIHSTGQGTKNMKNGPAMSKDQAIQSISSGIRLVNLELGRGLDIVGTGDMGIGNTTSASAITSVVTGEAVKKITGRGTGIGDKQLNHKIEVIKKVISVNRPDPKDAIDVLAKVGGFEIGGIVGVILGAAANRIPVMIDGFISGSAALLASVLSSTVKEYLIASHLSAEPGHKIQLEHLGLKPLLSLGMRLGEGTGAALGIYLADISVKILSEMSTFQEASVSGPDVIPCDKG